MRNAFYLLLVVIGLLATSVVLIYHPSEPQIVNHTDNITFRKDTHKQETSVHKYQNGDMVAEKMADRFYHQSIIVDNNQFKVNYNASGKSGVKSFVNENVSISSGMQNVQYLGLNGGNIAQYKRYAFNQELTPNNSFIANSQPLQISSQARYTHTHSHSGDVVEIGKVMGASGEGGCPHKNVVITEKGLRCLDCGAIGTLTSVGGQGSAGITWLPLGDVLLPMLLMALGYLLLVFIKRH